MRRQQEVDQVCSMDAREAPSGALFREVRRQNQQNLQLSRKHCEELDSAEVICLPSNIGPATGVGKRGETRVGALQSPLLKRLPARESLEQPIPDGTFEVSSGENEPVRFFKRQSYEISASLGCVTSIMRTAFSVSDSGGGLNSLRLRCLAENWRPVIHSLNSPSLKNVSNRSMRSMGLLLLSVRFGHFIGPHPVFCGRQLGSRLYVRDDVHRPPFQSSCSTAAKSSFPSLARRGPSWH